MGNKFARIVTRLLPIVLSLVVAPLVLVASEASPQNQSNAQPRSQTSPPTAVVPSETHLVTIDVVATDSHGM